MAMDSILKFNKAIANLKPFTEYAFHGPAPTTEELFNQVLWVTGVAENDTSITTTVNPHTELTWTKVNNEMTRLETEYDSFDYARLRKDEYPSTKEFMEAYTEKEIGGDSTKWDAYIVKYNKVRNDNPKP